MLEIFDVAEEFRADGWLPDWDCAWLCYRTDLFTRASVSTV